MHINDLLDNYEKIPCPICGRLCDFVYNGHLESLMIKCKQRNREHKQALVHEWADEGICIDLDIDDEELQEYIQKYHEKFIRKTEG